MKKALTAVLAAVFITLVLSGCSGEPGGKPKKVEYRYKYAGMKLGLPRSWDYEILPAETEDAFGDKRLSPVFGIRFWPKEQPAMEFKLFCHINFTGLCGFGVTVEPVTFKNGLTANKYTEEIDGSLAYDLIYNSVPGEYIIRCVAADDLWTEYKNDIDAILESVSLGRDCIIPEAEAIETAKTACTVKYNTAETKFDVYEGVWEIRFKIKHKARGSQTVRVDADGNILGSEYDK